MVLAGATTIKRERVPNEVINELVIFDGTSADDGVGVGGGASAGAGQHEGLPLVDDVLSFSVRSGCERHCINECAACIYSKGQAEKRIICQGNVKLKRKMFGEISRTVMEEVVTEYKNLNIYRLLSVAEKEAVIKVTSAKDIRMEYDMHVFTSQDFRNMTSLTVWHRKYPDNYDPRDRILDINFYTNFLHRFNQMSDKAKMSDGKSMSQLVDDFVWDDDMIDYVMGIRPTPGGMDWIDVKRILTVMNTSGKHFVTLEILLHED
ncbi:hypothetical protein EJD97_012129 [Solanum chilense]|uniref:Uncharacterized protein n=1 Tax=Solanum chilense TaxID=4083 RepID=A0A6N2AHA1_SOLCI|nr:hypothetical protein EJD97_012129 [Solanum chilense]